jgi:hypothetical protein
MSLEQDQRAFRSLWSFFLYYSSFCGSLEHLLWSSMESRVGQAEAQFLTAYRSSTEPFYFLFASMRSLDKFIKYINPLLT